MVDRCPRCGTYCYERHDVRLTEMKAAIFDMIASAAAKQSIVDSLDLAERFYGSTNRDKQAIVRQHILQMNNLFVCTDICIKGTRAYGYTVKGLPKHAVPLRTEPRTPHAKTLPRA